MYRFFAILLLSTLAYAQAARTPASPPASPQAAVSLNDSDNARKARAVVDQTIQALGGQPYLSYENKKATGRNYPLYHGPTETTGTPSNSYLKYQDKDRFELV